MPLRLMKKYKMFDEDKTPKKYKPKRMPRPKSQNPAKKQPS